MRYVICVLVLAVGLMLKATEVAGADAEYSAKLGSTVDTESVPGPDTENPTKPDVAANASQPDVAVTTSDDPVSREIIVVEEKDPPIKTQAVIVNSQSNVAEHSSGAGGGSAETLTTTASGDYSSHEKTIGFIPMLGGSVYGDRWSNHITNNYTAGLALDIPVHQKFFIELEGSHGNYDISYGTINSTVYHGFNQYTLGGNLKLMPLDHPIFQPWLGVGLMGIYFENMSGYNLRNEWVGGGQLMAGADIMISDGVALGARVCYIRPLFNRPTTLDNGVVNAPGFEEAAAINQGFFRFLGTVKVSL